MRRRFARKLSCNLAALLFLTGGFTLLGLALRQTQKKEGRDVQRQREEWFYRQRAFPHKFVPAGAHQRALKQLEQKLTAEKASRAMSKPSGQTSDPSWTFIGPQPI